MKNILKYLLEFILVIFLGFVVASTLPSILKFDGSLVTSYLFVGLGLICLLGIFGIVYRWIKNFLQK